MVVHPDRSVTFTLRAPEARRVKLAGSFLKKPVAMQKTDSCWMLRIPALAPELYTYRFLVDKEPVLDPDNERWMRDVDVMWNYFVIEDSVTSLFVDDPELDHGRLEYVWYPSTLNGMSQRRMAVYLPSQYDQSSDIQFPVLYLLHGSGGDETTWVDCGRACQILDRMIGEGQVTPCIVVMPNGNAELDAAPGESPWMYKAPTAMNVSSMTGMVERAFVKEIVQFVDRRYRTLPDKAHRAIAGLSLGGLHAIYISANHPDLFDYVGLFSAQASNMLDDERRQLMIRRAHRNNNRLRQAWGLLFNFQPSPSSFDLKLQSIDVYGDIEAKLSRQAQTPPRLYYITIGKDDKLLRFNQLLMQKLDQAELKYELHLTPGSHSWENWRRYLVDFLPLVFQE